MKKSHLYRTGYLPEASLHFPPFCGKGRMLERAILPPLFFAYYQHHYIDLPQISYFFPKQLLSGFCFLPRVKCLWAGIMTMPVSPRFPQSELFRFSIQPMLWLWLLKYTYPTWWISLKFTTSALTFSPRRSASILSEMRSAARRSAASGTCEYRAVTPLTFWPMIPAITNSE